MRYFLSNITPLRYLGSGNLRSRADFLHPRRQLNENVLLLVQEGTLHISQNGVDYTLGPKEFLLLRGGEEHFGSRPSAGKLSYMWVHFTFSEPVSVISRKDFSSLVGLTVQAASSCYVIPEHGKVSLTQKAPLLFNQLLDLSRQEILYSEKLTDFALSLLMMELSQEFIEMQDKMKNKIPPNMALIMEWIRANYFRPLTVGEIAEEFGYNPNYLSSLFKKSTGLSLVQYINQTRVDISKSLLVSYRLSVKEAAYSCGFTDEKYYMKTFKKLEGMTPAQYKEAFTRKRINC